MIDPNTEFCLLHNPACSKSRAALALIRERGHDPRIVEYLKTPLDAGTLDRLFLALGAEPRAGMRQHEPEYRDLGLDAPELDRSALLQAIAEHPRLLERPILVRAGRAVIGRPPERVLDLL